MLLPSNDPLAVHLAVAAGERAAIVLSLPGVGGVKHYRSRLLEREADGTIWVSIDAVPPKRIDDLLAAGKAVAISFRGKPDAASPDAASPDAADADAGDADAGDADAGGRKITLPALSRRRTSAYSYGTEPPVPALLLQPVRPPTAELTADGRPKRIKYRVSIPQNGEYTLRLWRIEADAPLRTRPPADRRVLAKMVNLSLGGVGARLADVGSADVAVERGQRLRVEITYHDVEILAAGVVRHLSADGPPYAGIAFEPLHATAEGRKVLPPLTRVVAQLQREELRRLKKVA